MKKTKFYISFFLILSMLIACVQTIPLSVSAASNDVPGIENGRIYYIKNLFSGHYMDVQGGGTDYDGQNVMGYGFHGAANQQWKAVRNSNGTYTFVSVASASGRVLDLTGTNIDIYTSHGVDAQQFTLIRDTSLAYGGTYYIKRGANYVSEVTENNNICVKTSPLGLASRWSFQAVDKNDVAVHAIYYPKDSSYIDTRVANSTITTEMNGIGYNTLCFTNRIASFGYQNMKTSDVWVFYGHGGKSTNDIGLATLIFSDSSGGDSGGYITAHSNIFSGTNISCLNSLGANALASERCILYIGCKTGAFYDDKYCLISEAFKKGAHFALGPTENITVNQGKNWLKKFFEKAGDGGTIRQCIDNANYYQNMGLLYYEGDVYAKFS